MQPRYGVWNTIHKEFQFGISEDTPRKAENKLFKKIGHDARKWRFEIREIKIGDPIQKLPEYARKRRCNKNEIKL